MKVRTNIAMNGHPSCVVFDLPDVEAKALIAQGNAVAASKDDGAAVESAALEQPENAAMPRARKSKSA